VSIALAIGANATVFGIFDALIFRPLPVPHASRVVAVSSRSPSGTFEGVSWPDFVDFRDRTRSFEGLIAAHLSTFSFAKDKGEQPQMKAGYLVSGNLFKVLHVEPAFGRGFKPEEDRAPGRDAVLVLSYEFWAGEFGGDKSIIGRQMILNGINFTVVGVAPDSFTGLDQFVHPAFYVPAMMAPALNPTNHDLLINRGSRDFTLEGRLNDGVSIAAARSEMTALAKSLEQSLPLTNRGVGATVRSEVQTRMESDVGDATLSELLFFLSGVVLLIACANVANLMLNRGQARTRELAIRMAIGASRARIIRPLLMESLLIAVAASALGLLIAQIGIQFASSLKIPSDIPIDFNAQLDLRVVCFAALAGVLSALVVAQVAGSLVLLVGATQLFHGFTAVLSHSPGFQTAPAERGPSSMR
jgi:predicted permease